MNTNPTLAERKHLALVKSLECSVCDASAPSEAHHPDQDDAFTAIALCTDCHRDPLLGWHGQKSMWKIHKMTELKALGVTIRRLMSLKSK